MSSSNGNNSNGNSSGNSPARLHILFVGVGGQGVLTGARMLGSALHSLGHPVVAGQLHGMSQRGGSVEAPVLVGPGSGSFIPARGADVVVGFEPLEALRALPVIGPETVVIVSRGVIVPVSLSHAGRSYPALDTILDRLRKRAGRLVEVDGDALAATAGKPQVLNMVLLGVLAGTGVLPVDAATLWEAMASTAPRDPGEANREAFRLGSEFIVQAGEPTATE